MKKGITEVVQHTYRITEVTPKRMPIPSREEIMKKELIMAQEDERIFKAIDEAGKNKRSQ